MVQGQLVTAISGETGEIPRVSQQKWPYFVGRTRFLRDEAVLSR